jgi:hypothetical protein
MNIYANEQFVYLESEWHVFSMSGAITCLSKCCLMSSGHLAAVDWSHNEESMHHHVGRANAVGLVVCWQQWQVQLRLAV